MTDRRRYYGWEQAPPPGWEGLTPLTEAEAASRGVLLEEGGPSRIDFPPGDPAEAFLRALAQLSVVLPHIFPPASAIPFCLPTLNVPVNVAAATTVLLIAYTVPAGRVGRIAAFGVSGGDLTNLRWDIAIRGTPRPPVAGLVVQYGTIAAPTLIPGPGIWLAPSDDIQVNVTNIGAGVIANVQARIDGYLWDA